LLPPATLIGDPESRLWVVAGDNASGKSLVVRAAASCAKRHGASPMTLSIRERTGAGDGEMNSFRRALMYGEEQEQSTGALSTKMVRKAFHNLEGWVTDGTSGLLVLDEPELGLSEGYAGAMGEYIAVLTQDMSKSVAGVILVSHSSSLLRRLTARYQGTILLTWLGHPGSTLSDLLFQTQERSVEELQSLEVIARDRRSAVARAMK
jgi:hypothetical protein